MPSSYTLGKHFEDFVQAQLASGRYGNASEVLRDALRLMEDRERKLASLDASIARGLADIEAGRVYDADEVFDELEAKLAGLSETPGHHQWFRAKVSQALDDPRAPVSHDEVERHFAARRRSALSKTAKRG